MNDVTQLVIDTKKHLKFVLVTRDIQVANDTKRLPDH